MVRTVVRVILLAALVNDLAHANNGFYFIGFGTESLSMGGADVAVARDTTALNTNPAGLASAGRRWDVYGTGSYALDVRHGDALGNDESTSRRLFPSAGAGISMPLGSTGIVAGAGLFVQGGAGNRFEDLRTLFGTRDELSAQLGLLKLSAGASYAITPDWQVGVSIAGVMGRLDEKLLPDTSVITPAGPFFGVDVDGLRAAGFSAIVGTKYAATDTLTLAATFSPKTSLSFQHGDATVNLAAAGLGRVRYRDVTVDGLRLPAAAAIGAAWKPAAETLVSLQLKWLAWSDALDSQTLTLRDPAAAAAPGTLRRTTPMNWRDQTVVAVGIAQRIERFTLYGGFNYGRNPIPSSTLTPLFSPAMAEKHLTAGLAYHFPQTGWVASTGLVYVFPKRVTYSNSGLPFGSSASERVEYLGVNAMLGYTW